MYVYPFIDQEWVIENIDHVMKEFLTIHPEFRIQNWDENYETKSASMSAKSRHKKNMMENMDTMIYRPIYHIAKNSYDRKHGEENKALHGKIKRFYNEWKECEKHLSSWKSNYESMKSSYEKVKKNLEEEFGRKSYEYQVAFSGSQGF